MNFLIDAQLPRRLARKLRETGHDALHTLDLPNRNRTSDTGINAIALREDRVTPILSIPFCSSASLASSF